VSRQGEESRRREDDGNGDGVGDGDGDGDGDGEGKQEEVIMMCTSRKQRKFGNAKRTG
jgi:hypothetical protein